MARIDSEWESLKGMLTFKAPYKNDEPAKSGAADDASPVDMATNVVEFPGPSVTAKIETGCEGIHSTPAVTPEELAAITHKIEKNRHDKTLMGRLATVERQIRKLTFLVTTFMTLAIALLAVLTFLGFKGNFVNWSASLQPQEIAAAAHPSSPEAMVPANDRQLSSAAVMNSPGVPQSVSATVIPEENVAKAAEMATSPAVAEPAPQFVGSLTSNKIHSPDCKWAALIDPKNLITFGSMAEAREKGYLPCPVCRPHEPDQTHAEKDRQTMRVATKSQMGE